MAPFSFCVPKQPRTSRQARDARAASAIRHKSEKLLFFSQEFTRGKLVLHRVERAGDIRASFLPGLQFRGHACQD